MRQDLFSQNAVLDQLKSDIPDFKVGDTLSVSLKIVEGEKERVQVFTGIVLARRGSGTSEMVALYRVAHGSAMERIFPIHSPLVLSLKVIKHGKVRRSKLYYLRGTFGKKAKVKERIRPRLDKEGGKPATNQEQQADLA